MAVFYNESRGVSRTPDYIFGTSLIVMVAISAVLNLTGPYPFSNLEKFANSRKNLGNKNVTVVTPPSPVFIYHMKRSSKLVSNLFCLLSLSDFFAVALTSIASYSFLTTQKVNSYKLCLWGRE